MVVEQLVGFVITDEGVFVTFGCQGRVELDAGVFEGTAAQHLKRCEQALFLRIN